MGSVSKRRSYLQERLWYWPLVMHVLSGAVLGMMLLSAMAGCGGTTTTTDPDPSTMIVALHIQKQPGATAHVTMRLSDDGKDQEFKSGETITCNGVFLAFTSGLFGIGGDYEGNVPAVPVGGTYTFAYNRTDGSPQTRIVFQVPTPLKFLSPSSGATVPLSQQGGGLPVYYQPGDMGFTVSGILQDSQGHWFDGQIEQSTGIYPFDAGALQQLAAGDGLIALTQEFIRTPIGTGFQSVRIIMDLTTSIQVTWV